jgi:isopentenyl-diphosphate delta-isomerase
MIEEVILVDEKDMEIGSMEKMKAHEESKLHRAFSVFLFNERGEMLIHQRALEKYHSGGLWTNACCSHPRPGENTKSAAERRLYEELRIQCQINEVYSFIYKAKLDKGLTEHEFDHVFFGRFNDELNPNPKEVLDWKYISIQDLNHEINHSPEQYTEWFKIALQGLEAQKIALKA